MINQIINTIRKIVGDKKNFSYFFVFFSYIILGLRFFYFILSYTPNILYLDQWYEFNKIIGKEGNFLQLFLAQHNEHRWGVGLIIEKLLAHFTHWDNRAETLMVGLLIFVSSVAAILVKKKLFEKIEIYDALIPYIFLNLFQYENLTWGFQIHFVLPLFFFIIGIFLLASKKIGFTQHVLIAFVNLISIFSAFHGLFFGVVVIVYYIFNYFLSEKKDEKKVLLFYTVLNLVIIGLYFVGFRKLTYKKNFSVDVMSLSLYGQFIVYEINSFLGIHSNSLLLSVIILIAFVFLSVQIVQKKLNKRYLVIFLLFLYSLLFVTSTAYGRIVYGPAYGASSRYVTHLIPLYFALYLTAIYFAKETRTKYILIFVVTLYVFFTLSKDGENYAKAARLYNTKNSWKNCYLKLGDVNKCNQFTGFKICPRPGLNNLQSKLSYLKQNKSNMFYR